MSLWDLHASQKKLAKQIDADITATAWFIRVISGQLWCCCGYYGIVIVDTELQQQRTILCESMGAVCDVAETIDGDVILATSNGLSLLRPDGE